MEYLESSLVEEDKKHIEGKKFWPRAAAYLIDFVILLGINYVAAVTFGILFFILMLFVTYLTGIDYYFDETENQIVNWIVGVILNIIYFTLFEWIYGATLGKVILGMKVVDIKGDACSLKQALIRAVFRIVDSIIFGAIAYANMVAPLFQRLGDKKGQTLVVSSKSEILKNFRPWWWFLIAFLVYFIIGGSLQLLVAFLYNIHFV